MVTYLRAGGTWSLHVVNRCRWNRRHPLQCLPGDRLRRWGFRVHHRRCHRLLLRRHRRSPNGVEIVDLHRRVEHAASRRRRRHPTASSRQNHAPSTNRPGQTEQTNITDHRVPKMTKQNKTNSISKWFNKSSDEKTKTNDEKDTDSSD